MRRLSDVYYGVLKFAKSRTRGRKDENSPNVTGCLSFPEEVRGNSPFATARGGLISDGNSFN